MDRESDRLWELRLREVEQKLRQSERHMLALERYCLLVAGINAAGAALLLNPATSGNLSLPSEALLLAVLTLGGGAASAMNGWILTGLVGHESAKSFVAHVAREAIVNRRAEFKFKQGATKLLIAMSLLLGVTAPMSVLLGVLG